MTRQIEATGDWRNQAGVTIQQAQAILPASRSSIWRMIQDGRLETFRLGRAVRITTKSVERIATGNTIAAKAA